MVLKSCTKAFLCAFFILIIYMMAIALFLLRFSKVARRDEDEWVSPAKVRWTDQISKRTIGTQYRDKLCHCISFASIVTYVFIAFFQTVLDREELGKVLKRSFIKFYSRGTTLRCVKEIMVTRKEYEWARKTRAGLPLIGCGPWSDSLSGPNFPFPGCLVHN